MLDDARLQKIRERIEKAMPARLTYVTGKTLIHFESHDGPSEAPFVTSLFSMPKNQEPLAEFIYRAAADIPALLSHIDALASENAALREAVGACSDYFHDFIEGDDEELELARICRNALKPTVPAPPAGREEEQRG